MSSFVLTKGKSGKDFVLPAKEGEEFNKANLNKENYAEEKFSFSLSSTLETSMCSEHLHILIYAAMLLVKEDFEFEHFVMGAENLDHEAYHNIEVMVLKQGEDMEPLVGRSPARHYCLSLESVDDDPRNANDLRANVFIEENSAIISVIDVDDNELVREILAEFVMVDGVLTNTKLMLAVKLLEENLPWDTDADGEGQVYFSTDLYQSGQWVKSNYNTNLKYDWGADVSFVFETLKARDEFPLAHEALSCDMSEGMVDLVFEDKTVTYEVKSGWNPIWIGKEGNFSRLQKAYPMLFDEGWGEYEPVQQLFYPSRTKLSPKERVDVLLVKQMWEAVEE